MTPPRERRRRGDAASPVETPPTDSPARERRRRGETVKPAGQPRGMAKFSITGRSAKFATLTVQDSTTTSTEEEAREWFALRYPDYKIELVVNHRIAYPWLRHA